MLGHCQALSRCDRMLHRVKAAVEEKRKTHGENISNSDAKESSMNLNHQIEYQDWIWIYHNIYLNHQFEINWIPILPIPVRHYWQLFSIPIPILPIKMVFENLKSEPKIQQIFPPRFEHCPPLQARPEISEIRDPTVSTTCFVRGQSVLNLVEIRMSLIMFLWYFMMFHDHQHQKKHHQMEIIKWIKQDWDRLRVWYALII